MRSTPLTPLAGFAADVHSQHGEDGILAEVLRRLDDVLDDVRWCVEFGAWDGVYLSNTANLILGSGWRAVLIEPVRERCDEIVRSLPPQQVTALCRSVGLEAPDHLDDLLAGTGVPVDFDLLSIDIDGDDIHVLRSLRVHRPKVVCIEYNPTIPNEVRYEQPIGAGVSHGSSAASIVDAAGSLGYSLVAVTASNLILVRSDLSGLVVDPGCSTLEHLRDDSEARCLLFVGYDGTLLTSTPVRLPWHDVTVRTGDLQVLPRSLRRFPVQGTRARRLLLAAWLSIHDRPAFRRWFAVRWTARTGGFRRAGRGRRSD